jgi:alpha-tubulin suppressor-like RCC1 family protein
VSPTPAPLAPLAGAEELSLGVDMACARFASGEVDCWGYDWTTRDATGSPLVHDAPTAIDALRGVKRIALGTYFGCALTASGSVVCWGVQTEGELGDGKSNTWRPDPEPVRGVTNAVELAAGFDHACARTADGAIYCWGANDKGQLGTGNYAYAAEAVRTVF